MLEKKHEIFRYPNALVLLNDEAVEKNVSVIRERDICHADLDSLQIQKHSVSKRLTCINCMSTKEFVDLNPV